VRAWSYIASNLGGEHLPRKKVMEVELDVDMIVARALFRLGCVLEVGHHNI
jgi:hypothetical protein